MTHTLTWITPRCLENYTNMAKRSPRRKGGGGLGVPHVIGAFVLAVAVAVGIDIAKSETESILKRNGLWPSA